MHGDSSFTANNSDDLQVTNIALYFEQEIVSIIYNHTHGKRAGDTVARVNVGRTTTSPSDSCPSLSLGSWYPSKGCGLSGSWQ